MYYSMPMRTIENPFKTIFYWLLGAIFLIIKFIRWVFSLIFGFIRDLFKKTYEFVIERLGKALAALVVATVAYLIATHLK